MRQSLPRQEDAPAGPVLLVGNPNAGKTTLFNQLTGLRAKTANRPGTTIDLRTGPLRLGEEGLELVDTPGLYSFDAATPEEQEALRALTEYATQQQAPRLLVVLLDASNLVRNLVVASQALELGIPTVFALNMMDIVRRRNQGIDVAALSGHLSAPVVPIVARTGEGIPELLEACARALEESSPPPRPKLLANLERPSLSVRFDWAEAVSESCLSGEPAHEGALAAAADRVVMHPVGGVALFLAVMFGVFYLIFSLAAAPMDWIDAGVAALSAQVAQLLPEGLVRGLVVDGVLGGVGGVLVFLPQICILFFCISMLEDTGYLPRAACVMDRVLRRFGLPGKAFVPMLSAHACAIPAIMSTRVIESPRDRLLTILVLPLMTCSARLPVYAMVTALLFPDNPARAAAAFGGAYLLGIVAALGMASLIRGALLRGYNEPMMMELPQYKWPSIKTAFLAAYDRGRLFLRKATTVILAISIVLWWLMTFPQAPIEGSASNPGEASEAAGQPPALVESFAGEAAMAVLAGMETAPPPEQGALAYSFAGRLGKTIEPALEPLGFDWKIGVGILASFAAREVFVSTLSVVYAVEDDEPGRLIGRLQGARDADGALVFDFATCLSLLVFYVLAMQCLPTQVVTAKETRSVKWALFQLGYMTALAYGMALVTYQVARVLGGA